MTVKRSKRIKLIVDLASNAEREAAKKLGAAQDAVAAEKKRLEDVNQYYQNYCQHFNQRTKGLTATDLAQSRDFLSNLDNACQFQVRQVDQSETQMNEALLQWRLCHQKLNALQSYQESCANSEAQQEAKREQKIMDELAANRFSYRT